jgi:hypothetical protein
VLPSFEAIMAMKQGMNFALCEAAQGQGFVAQPSLRFGTSSSCKQSSMGLLACMRHCTLSLERVMFLV